VNRLLFRTIILFLMPYKAAIILLLMPFIASCSHTRLDVLQAERSGKFFKKDMVVCVDEVCDEGMIVAPRRKGYDINIEAKNALDLFVFTTCAREETSQKHSGRSFFRPDGNSRFKTYFKPAGGVEDVFSCPAHIEARSKKGTHSAALIAFETPETNVPVKFICNGKRDYFNGVSACQSRAGLTQLVSFKRPVTIGMQPPHLKSRCDVNDSNDGGDGLRWEFKMPRGECVFAFFDADGNVHRMVTYGYDSIIIRED